jgi:predicted 3-demethylubiquinone-9 3-methyltransferase (glyoxalase superfamily)
MPTIQRQKITPFLWFDSQAEEAARFYVTTFDNSRIKRIARYGEAGKDVHGKKAGSVMTVEFDLDGVTFVALNGGPHFQFNEAVSFWITCETQDEIDYFWNKLCEGGQESVCGWLKDKYGLSWQVVPSALPEMLADADGAKTARVMAALLQMKKLNLAALQRAYAGP